MPLDPPLDSPEFSDGDFGDAFDALPALDLSLDADGPAAEALSARKARLASALVTGETGVQYEALALFAEPLFALYEHDPAEAFALRGDPAEADDEAVALLEMARVLWAFFSMPPPERAHKRPALAAQLVGDDPTDEDWLSLDALMDTAEIHWHALLPEEIAAAQATGHPTLDFEALLQHPAFHLGAEDTASGFGPESLSDAEARALFAQSMLDDVGPDLDAFEDALARADAYWEIAQEPDPTAALDAFAREQADPAAIRAEGTRMMARYRTLFG